MRLCIGLLVWMVLSAPVLAKEPRVPPGLSPIGAVTIAILGPGIDYRVPSLRNRLARDGEGVLMSWDLTDNDTQPFAPSGGLGTQAAEMIARLAPKAQLMIVKEQPGDPQSLGHMLTFVTKTPTRIIVWQDADPNRPDWPILAEAVKRFSDRLFIIPAGGSLPNLESSPAYAGIRGAANVVIVAHGHSRAGLPNGKSTAKVVIADAEKGGFSNAQKATLVIAALACREQGKQAPISIAALKQYLHRIATAGIEYSGGWLSFHDGASAR
jgi:hypothetical protein